MATGSSMQEAADTVGVHVQTIYRWMDDPEFAAEIDKLQQLTQKAAVSRLRGAAQRAADTLAAAMNEGTWSERIRAADLLLSRIGVEAGSRVTVQTAEVDREALAAHLAAKLGLDDDEAE
jgi:hypothetical protein